MTRLEQVEYRLDYLLSRYEETRDPTLRLPISILAAERRKLLAQEQKPAEVD